MAVKKKTKAVKKTAKNTKHSVKKSTAKNKAAFTGKKQKSKRHHLKHHPLLTLMRVVKNGFKNLWRNLWLSVAATAIMAVTLSTILLAGLSNKALNDTIDDFSKDLKLSVYLIDNSDKESQDELRDDLRLSDLVSKVDFVSKEDAKKEFAERYKDQEELVEVFDIVEVNVLPASFEITMTDLSRIDEVVSLVEDDQYEDVVDSTSDDNQVAEQAIDDYTAQQRLIIAIGVTIAAVFAVISVMVIFNTIRLAIYSRADEVRIMKLLGASHGYIRGPFLFEATMYGVFSGLLSFGFVTFLLKNLLPRLTASSFSGESLSNSLNEYAIPFYDQNWEVLLLGTIVGGVIIGFVSSALALSRYMRY